MPEEEEEEEEEERQLLPQWKDITEFLDEATSGKTSSF